ncbi:MULTISPECIES: type VII secretion protein EccB [unclassified Corynebacterium]|uniref:type VII secretion protein EccB n=1 Tax=unclassified Corynebacterium TaxID=2624378 RepID=UPI0029CA614A|nr:MULTISPECIES: type VII secretion protein EccB [unclassified Corynebacterium]WPF66518.1 type VII secretion protein EccB [Corynebacterium sp. 22KM0430]WPF69007.1 type VII secretion protein EccB [Corynebacterium sp. 21KM1197]
MPHQRTMLASTTQAQVSGHRFLLRRMHHGLVLGDTRMIHDPLAKRHRAATFGTVLTVLLLMGAGMLAVLDPKPSPSEDAALLRATRGALYVRVAGEVHPVPNLASARLVLGKAEEPADISDEELGVLIHGRPVGVNDAPGFIADAPPPEGERTWTACARRGTVSVELGGTPRALAHDEAVLLRDTSGTAPVDYLVTARGRAALPPAETPEGVILRRRLGVRATAPVWSPPAALVTAIAEQEAFSFPTPLPEVWSTGDEAWLSRPEGIHALTETQADMLTDMGAPHRNVSHAQAAARPEAPNTLRLPEHAVRLIDPATTDLCVMGPEGTVGTVGHADEARTQVKLPNPTWNSGGERGEVEDRLAVAETFSADLRGAIAVDAGAGYHVVTAHGVRHRLPDYGTIGILGLPEPIPGWWPVLSLLPEGTPLSEEEALRGTR